jgi:ubiquinone/menaquinone biosynthesis C-methylase UbiE
MQRPPENAGASGRNVEQAYDRWALSYDEDENATRDLDARVLRGLLPELPGRDVLELGCGTGKNTLVLAAARSVVAADFSAGMMGRAREKVAASGASNVSFVRLDARDAFPFQGASFDLVAVDLVLEHMADLGRPLQQIARMLRPRGLALLVELHPYRQLEGKQARFRERGRGDVVLVPAFAHSIAELVGAALGAGLALEALGEWSDADDATPRLVSMTLRRP